MSQPRSIVKQHLEPDPARVAEIAKFLPEHPTGLGRPIEDRAAWEQASRQPWAAEAVKLAEAALEEAPPVITEELTLVYRDTGDRQAYQKVEGRLNARLREFAVAECLEDRGRFLPALEAQLTEILDRRTWVLPAHDNGQNNYYGKQVTADLGATMLAWSVGTVDYWLGARLRPALRQRLRAEVRRRVLEPYRHTITTGDAAQGMWWVDVETNWNSVCTSGTLGAALAVVEDPAERAWFVASAEKHLPRFLEGFGPDGYCSEGLGYWNYGFSHYILGAEAVYEATGGRLDWFADSRVVQVAKFAQRLRIAPGRYPAFADCEVGTEPFPVLLAILNRRVPGGSGLETGPAPRLVRDQLYLGAVSMFPPVQAGNASGQSAPTALRDYFQHAGILTVRPAQPGPRTLAASLKAGHNAEMHNHNDVGSYVVLVGDEPLLIDPGNETYTARTFSSRRYESTVLNSYGHPVPVVAGQLQRTGEAAHGQVLAAEFTEDEDVYRLDLRSCYEVPALLSLVREFRYSRAGQGKLVVTDHVKFSQPSEFGTALITLSEWKPAKNGAVLLANGKSLVARISAQGGTLAPLKEEKLPDGKKPTRLGVDFAEPVKEAVLRVELVPGEG
jgi:hypothetical protein